MRQYGGRRSASRRRRLCPVSGQSARRQSQRRRSIACRRYGHIQPYVRPVAIAVRHRELPLGLTARRCRQTDAENARALEVYGPRCTVTASDEPNTDTVIKKIPNCMPSNVSYRLNFWLSLVLLRHAARFLFLNK